MNKPRIRSAVINDAAALSELAFRSKAMWGYDEWFMEQCRDGLTVRPADIENRSYRFGVCEWKDRIAGFYAMRHIRLDTCELEALFVEPDFTRQGIGSRLLRHGMSDAAGSGARYLVVESDPYAEGFYLAAGGVAAGMVESGSIARRYLRVFRFDLTVRQAGWRYGDARDRART